MSGFALGDTPALATIGSKGNYAKFSAGTYDIRMLMSPGPKPMSDTIYPVGVHYLPVGYKQNAQGGDDKQTVRILCPRFTHPYDVSAVELEEYHRKHCPICNFLNNDILHLDQKTMNDLNRARVRRTTAVQFLDYKDIIQASGAGIGVAQDPASLLANCTNNHVRVWEMGPDLAVNLKSMIMDPNMKYLFDPERGFFVHVVVTGVGIQKKYAITANTNNVFPVSMEWLKANVHPFGETYSQMAVDASQATAEENLARFKALYHLDRMGGVPGAAQGIASVPAYGAPAAVPAPAEAAAPLFGAPVAPQPATAAPLFAPPAVPQPQVAAPAVPPVQAPASVPAVNPDSVMGVGTFADALAAVEDED